MFSTNKYTAGLVRKTAIIATTLSMIGALTMYVFGNQAAELSWIALADNIVLLTMLCFILRCPNYKHNAFILIFSISFAILFMAIFSGGVYSRMSVLIPILPIIMCLLLQKRQAIVLTAILVTTCLSMTIFRDSIPNFSNLEVGEQELFVKTLWLVMAQVIALFFALAFVDINSKLTIKLEASGTTEMQGILIDKSAIFKYAELSLLKIANSEHSDRRITFMLVESNASAIQQTVFSNGAILKHIGKAIQRLSKSETDLIGELTEHRLLVCLHHSSSNQASDRANQIIDAISCKPPIPDLTVNIGYISVDHKVSVDFSSLLSITEIALNKAKEQGVNTFVDYAKIKK